MAYYEFKITVPEETKDALLNRMSEMGCLGVTDYGNKIVAYFKDSHDIVELRDGFTSFREVLKEAGLRDDFTFEYLYLGERDWNESWKKKFHPIDVGGSFSILPPWEKERQDRVNIVIDPGMAFGTGHHQTTRACLVLIERYARQCPRERFLDVGTGTGVLAICASKMGFKEVVAVDTDPLAVDAAVRNVRHNHLENIVVHEGSITAAGGTYDFIAANLLSGIIQSMASEMAARLRVSGILLLSGIIGGQEREIITTMEELNLHCVEKDSEDIWVSLIFRSPKV